jgi:uncharacterized repeat protein (TIGR03847 family)
MSMRRPRYNMRRAKWIGVEAIGVPGQRTFRLLAYSDAMSAQLWLEKELLQELARAIAQVLVLIDSEKGVDQRREAAPSADPKPPDFPGAPDIDFQIVKFRLRYDKDQDLIALEAFDPEAEDDTPPTFRCVTTRQQMESLQLNSLDVISAGRPRCPLCGTPLAYAGMPHFCPPTNGHQKIVEESEE